MSLDCKSTFGMDVPTKREVTEPMPGPSQVALSYGDLEVRVELCILSNLGFDLD